MFPPITSTFNLHARCTQDSLSVDDSPRYRRSVSPTIWINLTQHASRNESSDSSLDFEEKLAEACHRSVFTLLEFFNLYYIPMIILLGLVGNLLSCIVFLNTHLRVRSSSYYLAALATADFGFLVILLLVWSNNMFGFRVFNKDGWCETLVYISAVCSSLSVWLIVAFTVERFIAVQYPLHRPHICTVSRAKNIVLSLVLLALISQTYTFVTAGVVNHGGEEICDMRQEYMEMMKIINIIDSIATLIVPLIMIIVMNTMIIKNLFKFGKRFRQTSMSMSTNNPSVEPSDINLNQIQNGNSNKNGTNSIKVGSISRGRKPPPQQSYHSSKINSSHPSRQQMSAQLPTPRNTCQPENCYIRTSSKNLASTRNQQSITKMLLLISTVFIILNSPSYVVRLWVFFFTLANKNMPTLLWCIQQFFMLLYYTNFSINFLLYAMYGVTFRNCLKQLLHKVLKSLTKHDCNPQRYA